MNTKNNMTAVDWLTEQIEQHILTHKNLPFNVLSKLKKQAKQMEKERAITFGIRVFPECSSLKTGRMEIDFHKFENLLNEMYGE